MIRLTYVLLIVAFSQNMKAQININNVSKISITDLINMNYETVNSYTFEIIFDDSIELWNTNQITRTQFEQEIFKGQTDSIYSTLQSEIKSVKSIDSLFLIQDKREEIFENAYMNYLDTVKAQFIKHIPEEIIVGLLIGIQDSLYDENKFKTQIQLADSISYGNLCTMTSYYPLIGMKIYSSTGDSIIVLNDGQQDLMIPWKNRSTTIDLYNPIINWSLHAILPEELNYNKIRLVQGMKK